MKLAAVYTVWDDWDLFRESFKNIRQLVDGVIIVFSNISNFGERSSFINDGSYFPDSEIPYLFEPDLNLPPVKNERNKRNYGLLKARELGYTHFLMMDADEFYEPKPFLKEKERFKNPDLLGLVCRVKCYFKSPTLTIGYDTTLVPFIHKITPDLCFMWNTKYPYAFHGIKKDIRIDPTRQMNIDSGIDWSEITMHHYSWIRPDFEKKIRNSTARANLAQSAIMDDLRHTKAGYLCKFYGKTLEPCSDLFNLWDSLPFITEQSKK